MEEIPIDIQISKMDILHAKELRKKLSKRISAIRVTDTIRLETVISAEKKYAMDLAIEWLYANKIIKKKTRYSFLKFAVENTIRLVLDEREKEKDLQQQQSAMDSLERPGS
ncbi:MAG: hypothetical protein IBX40_08950 [Methanosarcinales archaeon]|nr:hypothetical protein [Methanosarcinales archaeon]